MDIRILDNLGVGLNLFINLVNKTISSDGERGTSASRKTKNKILKGNVEQLIDPVTVKI